MATSSITETENFVMEEKGQAELGLGEWATGMSKQEISEWIIRWWEDQVANRETYHQMKMRNRDRIMKALSEEPDYERLKEGYKIVEAIRESARDAGVEDMTMEEIDAEIAKCRQQMRERKTSC